MRDYSYCAMRDWFKHILMEAHEDFLTEDEYDRVFKILCQDDDYATNYDLRSSITDIMKTSLLGDFVTEIQDRHEEDTEALVDVLEDYVECKFKQIQRYMIEMKYSQEDYNLVCKTLTEVFNYCGVLS